MSYNVLRYVNIAMILKQQLSIRCRLSESSVWTWKGRGRGVLWWIRGYTLFALGSNVKWVIGKNIFGCYKLTKYL